MHRQKETKSPINIPKVRATRNVCPFYCTEVFLYWEHLTQNRIHIAENISSSGHKWLRVKNSYS